MRIKYIVITVFILLCFTLCSCRTTQNIEPSIPTETELLEKLTESATDMTIDTTEGSIQPIETTSAHLETEAPVENTNAESRNPIIPEEITDSITPSLGETEPAGTVPEVTIPTYIPTEPAPIETEPAETIPTQTETPTISENENEGDIDVGGKKRQIRE